MSEDSDQVCWTDDQWNLVRKTVAEEAQKARVAAQFLPLFGPVDPSTVAVPNLRLHSGANPTPPPSKRLHVDSTPATFLASIEVLVELASREMADPELSAALAMFRRAAGYVARVEDALIFNGQPEHDKPPQQGVDKIPAVWRVTGGGVQDGLLPVLSNGSDIPSQIGARVPQPIATPVTGELIINAVVTAINGLEATGHFGPYACVLAPDLFSEVCTPSPSLVLPRDRVLPFLDGGSLLRTSAVPDGFGVVVALGGNPVEIVVARDISVKFLQTTLQPRSVFRVAERLVLRIKEMEAIAVLYPAGQVRNRKRAEK